MVMLHFKSEDDISNYVFYEANFTTMSR